MPTPRTAEEFLRAGHRVLVRCRECGNERVEDPEIVVLVFGADCDLYHGRWGLSLQLDCDACGAERPEIELGDPRTFARHQPQRRAAGGA